MWSSKLVLFPCEKPPPPTPTKKKKEKTSWPPLGGSGRCAMGWQILPCYWLGSSTSREGSTLYGRRGFLQINRTSPSPPPPPPPNELAPPEWAREMCNPLAHPMVTLVWLQYAQRRLFTEYQITFLRLASPRFKLYPPEPARTMRN